MPSRFLQSSHVLPFTPWLHNAKRFIYIYICYKERPVEWEYQIWNSHQMMFAVWFIKKGDSINGTRVSHSQTTSHTRDYIYISGICVRAFSAIHSLMVRRVFTPSSSSSACAEGYLKCDAVLCEYRFEIRDWFRWKCNDVHLRNEYISALLLDDAGERQ